jgi:hypothetical protein
VQSNLEFVKLIDLLLCLDHSLLQLLILSLQVHDLKEPT